MNTREKIDISLKVAGLVIGLATTAMFGAMISKVAEIATAVDHITATVERLVEIGPEGIADVGRGISEGAEEASRGAESAIERLKGALNREEKP